MSEIYPSYLAIMGFGVNAAIDSGSHQNISPRMIRDKIEDGTIFHFLKNDLDVDISLITDSWKMKILEHWQSMNNATTPEEMGAVNNGLCLLIAYILEDIQNFDTYYK